MNHATLRDRTAIVTGAGLGVGAAAARALSGAGASVVLAGRDGQALEALAAKINSAGGHAVAVPTDLTNAVSVRRLVEQTLGAFGRLDAVVNNAGVSLAMIPSMRPGGRVVNVATGDPRGVIELTRTAALHFAGSGVRINAVAAEPDSSVEDVASAVVLLCSDNAMLDTGEVLSVPSTRRRRAASSR